MDGNWRFCLESDVDVVVPNAFSHADGDHGGAICQIERDSAD